MKLAVFPGSFDPITTGHQDIILRGLGVFDRIIVAVGVNSQKSTLFSLDQRMQWLRETFAEHPQVSVDFFEGLTAHYAQRIGARHLIRGLRNASDFDYEKTISQLNTIVGSGVLETVFLISQPEYSHISSTIVREIIKGKGDVRQFVPRQIGYAFEP